MEVFRAAVFLLLQILALHDAQAENSIEDSLRHETNRNTTETLKIIAVRNDSANQIFPEVVRRDLFGGSEGHYKLVAIESNTQHGVASPAVLTSGNKTTVGSKVVCNPLWKFECRNGECISKNFRCDGDLDCPDNSDEEDCPRTENGKCKSDHFSCVKDSVCIPKLWMCDGDKDCVDGSDEDHCSSLTPCEDRQFRCHRGPCLSPSFLCDGSKDCPEGDDEKACETQCKSMPGHYQCGSGDCVLPEALCNGRQDCEDGSDEGGRCNETCPKGQCSYRCFMTPRGPHCICAPGHHLTVDGCQDVNECEGNVSVCDHFCKNVIGSFVCSCHKDYRLQPDNATCKLREEGGTAFLLIAQRERLTSLALDGSYYTQIYRGSDTVIGVGYDPVTDVVIWSTDKAIVSASSRGGAIPNVLVEVGLGRAEGLAVDWLGRNMYVTDAVNHFILVCVMTGEDCVVLWEDLPHPRGIQLDLENGYMYWSDVSRGVIEKAGMDGSSRRVFLSEGLKWPNALALDQPAGRLYWMDAHEDSAYSIKTDGTDRKHLAQAMLSHPYALSIWEEHIYWTDWNNNFIHSAFKRSGKHTQTVLKGSSDKQYYGLSVYHSSMLGESQEGTNPCTMNQCSHLCLLSPTIREYTCACPSGTMKLAADGRTCVDVENRSYPVVVTSNKLYLVNPRVYGRTTINEWNPNLELTTIGDLEYDPKQMMMVVSDVWNEVIYGLSQVKGVSVVIVNNTRAVGLSVDWVRGNLYWVDGKHGVEVVRLTGSKGLYRTLLLYPIQYPTDVAVAPLLGLMYVSGAGNFPYILRCGLDGQDCAKIVNTDLGKPVSLTFDRDPEIKRLYWCDLLNKRIESIAADGSDRRLMVRTTGQPISLMVTGAQVAWALEDSSLLFIASKVNMTNIVNITLANKISSFPSVFRLSELAWKIPHTMATSRNACSDNGNCSQLCLGNVKNDQVCGCGPGFTLSHDGVSCRPNGCAPHLFMCTTTHTCIPAKWRCDGEADCDDGADEQGCQEPEKCEEGEFRCNSGNCISSTWLCDGVKDCTDGSDEPEHCEKKNCPRGQWLCSSGECITNMWVCDGDKECRDGSDEVNCNTTFSPHKYTCKNGDGISLMWRCDGDEDCDDGSDEKDCEETCGNDEFACDNKQCVSIHALCDGDDDCGDRSDENVPSCHSRVRQEGPLVVTCPPSFISCNLKDTSRLIPLCIPHSAVCDGIKDCPQGEDEDCAQCHIQEHHCPNSRQCIPLTYVCDGEEDCDDGSDEGFQANCTTTTSSTTITAMPPFYDSPMEECGDEEFQCGDGTCIAVTSVCDGVKDCMDDSDEGHKCGPGCSNNNGGCQHLCHPLPSGRTCSCNPGFVLDNNGRDCLDNEECKEETLCSQTCLETKGSYLCSCLPGYSLQPDKISCTNWEGPEYVVLVKNGSLSLINHRNLIMKKVDLPLGTQVDSLDYDPVNRQHLYVDGSNGSVGVIKINQAEGSVSSKPLLMNRKKPQGLSFDPTSKNFYYSEFIKVGKTDAASGGVAKRDAVKAGLKPEIGFSFLMVCTTEGNCSQVARIQDFEIPSTRVAVRERRLFYCANYLGQRGETGVILSSFLDGSSRRTLRQGKVARCGSVAVDEAKRRVYWTDMALNTVESVTWEGVKHRVVQKTQVISPKGLTILKDWVMWINPGTRELVRCHKYNGSQWDRKPLNDAGLALTTVTPLHFSGSDPCESAACPYLCTSFNQTAKCLCPVGFKESLTDPGKCVKLAACEKNPCYGHICEAHTNTDFICRCDEGRLGARCEVGVVAKAGQTSSSATTTAVVLVVLLVLAAVALGLYWHRKHPFIICKSKRGSSSRVFKFVNPAFGVMSDETIINSSPVPSSCPSSDNPPPYAFTNPHPGHNFENPFFKADDSQANTSLDSAVASATDSTSVNIITSQVDLSSPLPPEMKFATPAEKKFKWPLSDPYNPSQV